MSESEVVFTRSWLVGGISPLAKKSCNPACNLCKLLLGAVSLPPEVNCPGLADSTKKKCKITPLIKKCEKKSMKKCKKNCKKDAKKKKPLCQKTCCELGFPVI